MLDNHYKQQLLAIQAIRLMYTQATVALSTVLVSAFCNMLLGLVVFLFTGNLFGVAVFISLAISKNAADDCSSSHV